MIAPIVIASWHAEKWSDGFYIVQQIHDAAHRTVYGPMPECAVTQLVAELQEIVRDSTARLIAALEPKVGRPTLKSRMDASLFLSEKS